MRVEDSQLRAFLADSGLVKPEDLKNAELHRLEAYILGIPFVDLSKETIDPDVLRVIPEPIARTHNIIAFKKSGEDLEVAMLDPDDLPTIDFIKKKAGLRILPRITTPESIKNVLKQYQKSLETEFGEILKSEEGAALEVQREYAEGAPEAEELKKLAEDLPIIRIVDTFIRHAILQSASDIHIEPTEKDVVVRYRIDGILRDAMTLPRQVSTGIVARIKVVSNLKLDEHRLPQDGRFKIQNDEYRISFRVSILPVFDGEKIVMRLLDETSK